MGLLGLLLFSLGVLVATSCSKCIPETVECTRYWVKLEPHKNLMESENELNSWCRKQRLFHRCIESVILGNGNFSDLPTNFLISKMFSEDLCTEDSLGRKRYLNNAACINQLNTEYCTLPEYLEILTPDDAIPSRCSMSEKTFSCIAATIVSNCGFDAGRVFRYLLKVTSYAKEVCDTEDPDMLPCEDLRPTDPEREEDLSEIFYGLVHRFGIIPEQMDEQDLSEYLNNEVETPVTEMGESLISEAIRSALDTIDEDSSPEQYESVMSDEAENFEYQTTEDTVDYDESKDSYLKKIPIITEPFKGLLHYNYSGQEYAMYWRQPNEFPIENVKCEHILPSFFTGVVFRCILYRRLYDPDCIASVEMDEPITPELIRDIDPEVPEDSTVDFGPRPYWMAELDEYKRQKELKEQSPGRKYSASVFSKAPTVGSITESPTHPEACTSKTRIHEMITNPNFKWWKCHGMFSERLRAEIVSVLLPDLREDGILLMSAIHSNNIAYVHFYETKLHDFESITCARVNECHPRGRGVFKCSIKPREIEECYNCYEEFGYPSPAFDNLRKMKAAPVDSEVFSKEDGASTAESSGDSEYETSSDELITLLLSKEKPISDKVDDTYTENIVAEEDELVAIDISTDTSGQYQNDASSGLTFVIIDQDVKLPSGESTIVPDNEQSTDDKENDSYKLSSDDEYRLLHENVLLLQAVQPNEDIHAIYEVDNSENHS